MIRPAAVLCWLLTSRAAEAQPLQRFEAAEPHMGTLVRITLYAAREDHARRAFSQAFARIRELDQLLSDYKPESEVSRLSTHPMPVGPDLAAVLGYALQISRRTGGAFDVTAAPLTHLWREARTQHRLPDPNALRGARRITGYRNLKLRGNKAWFAKPDMRLDLGGVAKGYAADQALAVLVQNGMPSALVAVSGDIAIGRPPPGREGWRITLEPTPELARTVELANCGVSTSGDREQYLERNGVRYSHIVDPRTGNALTRPASASVIAPSAMQADAIATSVCVLGHAKPFARMPGVTIVR